MKTKNEGVFYAYSISDKGIRTFLGKSKNLVVNNGLRLIASRENNDIISKCVVSTDTSKVVEQTNQIPSIIAITDNIVNRQYGSSDVSPYFYWSKTTFEFPSGSTQGNLTKVGITDSNDEIFSVALFKDIEGNPTSIQPLSNERLIVIYEYKLYIDPSDLVENDYVISESVGTQHNITIRPANINSANEANNIHKGLFSTSHLYGSSSPIQDVVSNPTSLIQTSSIGTLSDAEGTRRSISFELGYEDLNLTDGIRSLYFKTSRGCFQIGIEPPFMKTQQVKCKLLIELEAGR